MGENVLAILRYLSLDASPLPLLTSGYTHPTTMFFSEFDWFIQYQFTTARARHPFAGLVRLSRESSWLSLAFQITDNHRRLLDGSVEWRPRAPRRFWRSTDRCEWACGHNASHPSP